SNSLATTHHLWDAQVAFLAKRYRVIRYDTRGHGRSDVPAPPYKLAQLVADPLAIMDHLRIERCAFMGISLGGMTGIGLALSRPHRIERLVCCDVRADAPAPFLAAWEERLAAVKCDGVGSLAASTLDRWLSPSFRAANPEAVGRLEAMFGET